MKKIVSYTLLFGVFAASLSACALHQPEPPQGIFINPEARAALSCKQLEEKISALEATPKTDVYNPGTNPSGVPFILKNGTLDKIKAMKRTAAKKGCYDRPAYIEQTIRPAQVTPAPPKLNFDQCFDKCKSLTQRSNEQCFDSCK